MWVAVVAIVIFCLFPFYWLINTSLKTGPDLSTSALLPPNPTLDNYESIFKDSNFTNALKNSAIVALATTALALIVGSFCAYALARLKIRFKFAILAIILTITTFPQITIAAPIFKLWRDIGLYNTIPGLVIPYLTFALPLAIYILTSFFREIPRDLEEAALVDGATNFQAFYKVVVPLAAPGLATAGHPDVHRGLERVPARDHPDLVAERADGSGRDRVLHGVGAVRAAVGHHQCRLGHHLDPVDPDGPPVPEADRRRTHRRRSQGVM